MNKKKLPLNSKNWYKAKMVEKCLTNKTQLIKYNQVYLRIRIYELINNRRKIDVQI